MNTLTKRILTSLFLLSFVMLGFFYTFILIILLILISVLSWIEFNGLIIKIFKDNSFKTKIFKSFVRVMTLIYLLIFSGIVFDVIKDKIAVREATKLNIPVVAISKMLSKTKFHSILQWSEKHPLIQSELLTFLRLSVRTQHPKFTWNYWKEYTL